MIDEKLSMFFPNLSQSPTANAEVEWSGDGGELRIQTGNRVNPMSYLSPV